MACDETRMWQDHLTVVLSTKPAGIVQEACQVLEEHGSPVKKLNSELYYSSTHACTNVSDMFSYTIHICLCSLWCVALQHVFAMFEE